MRVKDCRLQKQKYQYDNFICLFTWLAWFFTHWNRKKNKARSLKNCLGLCFSLCLGWHENQNASELTSATILGTLSSICINKQKLKGNLCNVTIKIKTVLILTLKWLKKPSNLGNENSRTKLVSWWTTWS